MLNLFFLRTLLSGLYVVVLLRITVVLENKITLLTPYPSIPSILASAVEKCKGWKEINTEFFVPLFKLPSL